MMELDNIRNYSDPGDYPDPSSLGNMTTNLTNLSGSADWELGDKLTTLFEVYGVFLVSLVGVLLNSVSVAVFLQPRMRRSSINILLLGLQVSDLVVVTPLVYISGFPPLFKYFGLEYRPVYFSIYFYAVALSLLGKTGSHYFTILVALERYIAVCHPLKVQVLCSPRRAMLASISIAILSVLITLPHWLMVERHTWLYVEVIVVMLIPFVVLLCFNTAICKGYRKSQRTKLGLRSTQQDSTDESLTLLLVSIVLVYLVCNSFFVVEYVTTLLSWYDTWFVKTVIRPLTDFLITVNSASNFVLYCAYGKKFRTEVGRVLGRFGCGKQATGKPTKEPTANSGPVSLGNCPRAI